jgi:hypothetical protein
LAIAPTAIAGVTSTPSAVAKIALYRAKSATERSPKSVAIRMTTAAGAKTARQPAPIARPLRVALRGRIRRLG